MHTYNFETFHTWLFFSLSPDNHSMDNDNETVLDIQIDKTGAYNVTVSNVTWLTSAPTFLRYDNRTASTKNGTLILNDIG